MSVEKNNLIERKLQKLGLSLPPSLKIPGKQLSFPWVRLNGNRAYISGHAAQDRDGYLSPFFGKVGKDISLDNAYQSARLTALSILGSIKREIGTLDRITWLRVLGMVNSAPGFCQQSQVINGFSDLILELYGESLGQHARSAIGVAELPLDVCVEIEAEIEIF